MPKRRAARRAAAKRPGHRATGKVVLVTLALCLTASGLTWAGWGRMGARHTAAPYAVSPPAPTSPGSFLPSSPAKEYVYAGGRLVATEEPAASLTPAVPTNLRRDKVNKAYLIWTDNSSDESGFGVERQASAGGAWSQAGTVGAGVTTYQTGGTNCETQYPRYRVRAFNAHGSSASSNEATPLLCYLEGGATVHDAVADFSATQNPAGAWSYGYRAAGGGGFLLFTSNNNVYGLPAGMHTWYLPNAYNLPAVIHNGTGVTRSYFGATQPTTLLNLYPGASGERSVVRWTAQSPGTAQVAGRFEGLDATTTAVSVVKNGSTSLFTGSVNGHGSQAPFSLSLTVAAGDTLEFQVAYNGNVQHDSTGLAVTVTTQGAPAPLTFDAVNDFSPTQSQGAAWAYGSRAAGGAFAALPNNNNLYGLPAGMHTWYRPNAYNLPAVIHNGTGAPQSYFGATQPTDLLNLYPGAAGEKSVVRWTAPRAGTAQVVGRFQGLDATTTAVAVVKNGATTLAGGNVNGLGNQAAFSLTVAVAAGDTLEFQVSYNGDIGHDSTGLAAAITLR